MRGLLVNTKPRPLYGLHGQCAAGGTATLPLGEVFSIRLTAIDIGQRGWVRDVNTGEGVKNVDNQAGGAELVGAVHEGIRSL